MWTGYQLMGTTMPNPPVGALGSHLPKYLTTWYIINQLINVLLMRKKGWKIKKVGTK